MPSLPYNNAIPQATDQLSVSQGQILTNFASINSYVNVDHVPFANNNAGKHNQSSYIVQSPAPSFAAGEVGIYNFNNAATTLNEAYIHKQKSGGTSEIPFTASILSTDASPLALSTGWTYLPSGILVKWGTAVTNNSAQNFPVVSAGGGTVPAFTTCLHVIASVNGSFPSPASVMISAFPNSGLTFTVKVSSGSNVNVSYLAFGF